MQRATPRQTSASKSATFRAVEMRYLRERANELMGSYGGQWIVLNGDQIVAASTDEHDAVLQAKKKRPDLIPFVTYIFKQDSPILIA